VTVWKHAQFDKIQIYPVTEILTFNFNVSVVNIAFLKYFAVFDPLPLTVCINCSFICCFIASF